MTAEDSRMRLHDQHGMTWTLADDRRSVRMQLPPLPVAGLPKPLNVFLKFDAATVDEILQRLSELRAQMLPAPQRN